jgi:hypothetical protein
MPTFEVVWVYTEGIIMFEYSNEPLLPFSRFLKRMAKGVGAVVLLVAISLLIGMEGYRITEGIGWVDAFYNAAMVLSGVGANYEMKSEAGKIFVGLYALCSGLLLVGMIGILLVPIFHRMLHRFHNKK